MVDDGEVGPPRIAEALLTAMIPAGIRREDIVGSLSEEFTERTGRHGFRRAVWWYRRQAAGVLIREGWSRATAWGRRVGGGQEMSWTVQDLKFAWRALRRAPLPYTIAIVTVALGVGANAAMFSIVNGVLISPLPYPDEDRLVRVWQEKRWSSTMLADVRESVESFDVLAGAMGGSLTLLGEGDPQVVGATQVTGGWFEALGAQPAVGRLIRGDDEIGADGPVALLSHGFWLREFGGDPAVVGRSLTLSGYGVEQRTIVGVVEESFVPYPNTPEVWIPWVTDSDVEGFRGTYGGVAIATLLPGVGEEQAIAQMRRLIPNLRDVHSTQFRDIRYSPVDVVPLRDSIVSDVRVQLYVLLGAVGFVLLIACTNVANVLLARASHRRREVGLRLALGASRSRILRQMVNESVFLALLGGAAGLGMAFLTMPALRAWLGEHLPRAELVGLDLAVVSYASVVSLVAGLAFGVIPGIRAADEHPAAVLGESGRSGGTGRRGARINEILVIGEVALSLVLVVGAGLMLKSLAVLSGVDPGFESEGVLAMNVVVPTGAYDEPDARDVLFREVIARVESVPGVGQGNVATVNTVPLAGGWSGIPYQVEGQEVAAGESIVGGFRLVSADYFSVLGIPLVEGRLLTDDDTREAEGVAVVNEAFVDRHWPGESGLGRILLTTGGNEMGRVVGVVGNTRFAGLDEDPVPSMYFPAPQGGWNTSHLLIRTDLENPLSLFGPIRSVIGEVDPRLPVRQPQVMTEYVAEAVGDERFYSQLLGSFAGLALVLGLIGVYGVMSYTVSQRTREVGIRVALGATGSSVLTDTLRRGMVPVLVGIGLGLVGAFAMSRSMMALLYEVAPTDPAVYAVVAALVALTGVAAILVPAWRAMRSDPVSALRQEM